MASMSTLRNPNPTAAVLPPSLIELLADLPTNVDRRTGAELVTKHLFPVSHRTLEAWPLPTRNVNGKAILATVALFEHAYAMLQSAPVIIGGRRSAQARLGI
jgi:hypothetical protein